MGSAYLDGSLALTEPNQTGKQKAHLNSAAALAPSVQNGVFAVPHAPHEQVSFTGMNVLSEFQMPESMWAGDGTKEGTHGSDVEYFDQMEAHLRFLNMDLEMEVLDLESCYNVGETYNNTEAGFASASYEPPRLSLRGELALARQRKKKSPSFKPSAYRRSRKGLERNQTDRQPRRSARLTAELQKADEIPTTPVTEIDTALEHSGVKGGYVDTSAAGKILDSSAKLCSQAQDADKLQELESEKQEVFNPSASPACNELEPDSTRKSRKERESSVSEKEHVLESNVGLARCTRRQTRQNAEKLARKTGDSSEEEFAVEGSNERETCDLASEEPAKLSEAQVEEIVQLRKMPERSTKKKSRAPKNKTDSKLEVGIQTRRKPETRSDRKKLVASSTACSGNVAQDPDDRQEPGGATGEDGGSVAPTLEEVSKEHISDEGRDAAEGQKTEDTDASSIQEKDFGLVEVDNTLFEVSKEHIEDSNTSTEIQTGFKNMESCAFCAQDFVFHETTVGGETGSEEHRPEATEEEVQSQKAETHYKDQTQLTAKAKKPETQASGRPRKLAKPVTEDRVMEEEDGQRESADAENTEKVLQVEKTQGNVVQIERKKAARSGEVQKFRMATAVNRRVTRGLQKRMESSITFDSSIKKPGDEGKDDNRDCEEIQEMDYPPSERRRTRAAAALEAVVTDSNAKALATVEGKPESRIRQKRGGPVDSEAQASVEAKAGSRTRQRRGVVADSNAGAEGSLEITQKRGVGVVAEAEASGKAKPGSRTRQKRGEAGVANSHAEAEASVETSRTRQKRGRADTHAETDSSPEAKQGSRVRQHRGEPEAQASVEGSRTRQKRGEPVLTDNYAEPEASEDKSGTGTKQKVGEPVVADGHTEAEAGIEDKSGSRTRRKRGEAVVLDSHAVTEANVEDKTGSRTRQKRGDAEADQASVEDKAGSQTKQERIKASLEAKTRRKRMRGVPIEELDAMVSETTTNNQLPGTGPKIGTTKLNSNELTSTRKSPRLTKQTPTNSDVILIE